MDALEAGFTTWAEGRSTPTRTGVPQDRGSDRRRRPAKTLDAARILDLVLFSDIAQVLLHRVADCVVQRTGARSLRPAALRKSALQRGKLRRIGQAATVFCLRPTSSSEATWRALSVGSGGRGAVASTDVRAWNLYSTRYARGRHWHHRWLLGLSLSPI